MNTSFFGAVLISTLRVKIRTRRKLSPSFSKGDHSILFPPWPRGCKAFFMLNSAEHEISSANKSKITYIAEHEIFSANKYENTNYCLYFHIY